MAPAPHTPMNMGAMATRLTLWIYVVGILLLFVGSVYIIAAVATPGCITNSPSCYGASNASGALTALMIGKILWVLGLTAIIVGMGAKLQYTLTTPSADAKDAIWRYIGIERLWHAILIIVLIFLIWTIVTSVNVSPPPYAPTGLGA
jgi:hypothetical protein